MSVLLETKVTKEEEYILTILNMSVFTTSNLIKTKHSTLA